MLMRATAITTITLRVQLSGASVADCDWPQVDAHAMKWAEFEEIYYEKQPVVLLNIMDDWPAMHDSRWTQEALLDVYGNTTFDSHNLSPNNRKLNEVQPGITLRDHLSGNASTSWFIFRNHPFVQGILSNGDFRVPEVLKPIVWIGPSISIGKRMQGNLFHSHDNSWLGQVHGRKKWIVFPPNATPPQDEFLLRTYREACLPPPAWPGVSSCTVGRGTVVYLPTDYQHETCSLDDFNMGIAYVSTAVYPYSGTRVQRARVAAATGNVSSFIRLVKKDDLLKPGALRDGDDENPGLVMYAAHGGHVEVMKLLLKNKVDLTAQRIGGYHPLHFVAMLSGSMPLVKLLAKQNADLSVPNAEGMTAKVMAARSGFQPMLKYLTESTDDDPDERMQAAREAAQAGHVSCLKYLLQGKGGKSLFSQGEADQLLHEGGAAQIGHIGVVQLMLEYGGNPRVVSPEGNMLVHAAAAAGHPQVLQVLADVGVDLAEPRETDGMAPIHLASEAGHVSVVEFLISSGSYKKAGGIHSSKDLRGWQATHYAALSGHTLVIQILADQGLNLNTVTSSGKERPIDAAVHEGHVRVVERLLNLRADCRKPGKKGKSLVSIAEKKGDLSIAELLRSVGCNAKGKVKEL